MFTGLILSLAILFTLCNCPKEKELSCKKNETTAVAEDIQPAVDEADLELIADTIIYEVLVQNPDEEDLWKTNCVKNVDVKKFVDIIFDAVYNGKITAYSLFNEQPMSIEDIKALEEKETR